MSRLNALAALTLATALSLGALAPPAAANDRLDLYKKRRALVIGIDEYKDPAWGALNYARSDAEAVGKKLTALGFSVDYLFDKDATRDGILARFNVLEQEVEEDDQVFVFFSGHGITTGSPKDKVGYLIPTDGVRSHLLKTALSLSVLRDLSRALKARHVMFALDACFAGNILENTRGPGGVRPGNRQIYNDMLQAKVRLVLAAANENQKAHEVDGRGLFTRALLDALNGAVKPNNADGILFGQDIATYIRSAVSDMAQRNHKKQNPIHGHLQGAA
ncbi:MAG TPA: caspase family protein, partial [Terriglobales bacterium]|nr:caspase family protein [Terriglobales bacterium]